MGEFTVLLIIFIAAGILQKIVKAGKTASSTEAPPDGEHELEDAEYVKGLPAQLRDVIAQELGLELERPPKVAQPGSATQRWPQPSTAVLPRGQEAEPPEVVPPKPGGERGGRKTAAEHGAEVAERRRAARARRRSAAVTRPAVREQRPDAVSLERPRRPEDHDLFHERYAVPQPVESHSEFHDRYLDEEKDRRTVKGPVRRVRLPDAAGWSAVQKAIVWAEVLGPPKGTIY